MSARRMQKVAAAIREVVSMAILTQLRDPRVKHVTVTFVEVSADLRIAKIHVSIMGTDKEQQLALRGLQHAVGFLQSKVGDRVQMRYTPRLQFFLDMGVKHSIEIARLLKEVLPDSTAPSSTSMESNSADLNTADDIEDDLPTFDDLN